MMAGKSTIPTRQGTIDRVVNCPYTWRMANEVDMEVVRMHFKASGMSLQQLGEKMGFEPPTARQAAFQFLKVGDPRLSSMKRFAKAVGVFMFDLIPSYLVTCPKCNTEVACYGGRDIPEPAKGTAIKLSGPCPTCGYKIHVATIRARDAK